MGGVRLAVALIAALPVAWERERATRIMGLRTFPLIAVASCGYVLVALGVSEAGGEAEARAVQGLITGIGFLGGGAILKEGATVRGTATAASVWSTGAIGAAAGFGHYATAALIGIINFLTLRVMARFEDHQD